MPLLCRIYPNGIADVNHFHAAGGMGFLIRELLDAGLLHEDVRTVPGEGGLRATATSRASTAASWPGAPAPQASLRSRTCCARSPSRSAPTAGSSCSTAISAAR